MIVFPTTETPYIRPRFHAQATSTDGSNTLSWPIVTQAGRGLEQTHGLQRLIVCGRMLCDGRTNHAEVNQ